MNNILDRLRGPEIRGLAKNLGGLGCLGLRIRVLLGSLLVILVPYSLHLTGSLSVPGTRAPLLRTWSI